MGRSQKSSRYLAVPFLTLFFLLVPRAARTDAKKIPVPVITVFDSINPGSGAHIEEAIEEAEREGAPFLVIQMDTPGGLLSTTRQIIQKMMNSRIPVVVFVSPKGAHAGSAGALITLAADVAVMAPGTNIGAAHPVTPGEKPSEVMQAKLANDTAAFARSLAKSKGRNQDWAEKAVRASDSITAEEALKKDVIDFIADDIDALATRLSEFKMKTSKGPIQALPAGPFEWNHWETKIKNRIVAFFANPDLAYLIMSIGAICLWIELAHPGLILPGVVGVLCLLLSLVSFQLLPISYGALALIFVGFGLLIAELFVPSFGVLGVGGIIAFVVGSLFLMDTTDPFYRLSLKVIFPVATFLAATALTLGIVVFRGMRMKNRSGTQTLVGEFAEVRRDVSDSPGQVFVQGELWNAVSGSGETIPKGKIVKVKSIQDLTVTVDPA